jgi:hypothetical protein
MRKPALLSLGFLVDDEPAAVVAAFAANGVVYVPGAAVGADGECRDESFVVCAALRGAGVRLSAFGMCHFLLLFFDFCFVFVGAAT